jgi:hypothetical protein
MGRGRPRIDLTELPMPVMGNGRWTWRRSDVGAFRRVLAGRPAAPAKPAADDGKRVTVEQLARLVGVHPNTVMRRLADARAQQAAAAASAATLAKMREILE